MSLSTYCVVEFLELPSPDVDKFVCVPDSWIMWTDTTNSGVCVAYPNENSAKIEELSRMNQTGPDIWLTYRAAVKYCTSSYKQAMNYLKVLRKIGSYPTISNVPTSQRRFSEGPSRPQFTATTSNSGSNNVDNEAYKRLSLRGPLAGTPTGRTRPQEKIKPSAGAAERSRTSGSKYSVHDDHPSRRSQTSLESRSPKVSPETSGHSSMHDVQATQDDSHGRQRPGTSSDHACCSVRLDDALESVKADVQQIASALNRWATVNAMENEKLRDVDAWVKDYQEWKPSVVSQLNKMSRKIKPEVIVIEDSDDHDDDDDDNHKSSATPNQVVKIQVPKRALRGKMVQFTLPPDYDPNDSRWTLRYRNPGPTLTEPILNSSIYVKYLNLFHILASAEDCKSLARLLMVEVFSDNALKVCSLTGARCPSFTRDSPVRPGLDENARNTMITYIKKCGRRKGWRIPHDQDIINIMRVKLEDCRRKANNNN